MCEILGSGDGKEAGQVGHGPADMGDCILQRGLHRRMTGAKRGILARHHAFQFGMLVKKGQRHRPRLIEIQINSNSMAGGALHERSQVHEALFPFSGIILTIERLQRRFRRQSTEFAEVDQKRRTLVMTSAAAIPVTPYTL